MSGKEKKRDKIKKNLKKLKDRLKNAEKDTSSLPKEIKRGIQTTLQDVGSQSLIIGGSLPFLKPNRENVLFQRMTEIVMEAGSQSPSCPQELASQLWNPKKPKKGTLADQIRNFDFDELYNLIQTIHEKWNVDENGTKKGFDDHPNPKALFAIKGLMNILTKIEQTELDDSPDGTKIIKKRIIGLSNDRLINEFFCSCFTGIENMSDDKDYYAFVVRGIKICFTNASERQPWQAY